MNLILSSRWVSIILDELNTIVLIVAFLLQCDQLYFLQSEGVQIHRLEEEMCRLIKRILGFLVPARAIVGVPLKEVEYGEELFIGAETKGIHGKDRAPCVS
ncbi:hypothetical protein AMECASPLE_036094 [Ameca splendens]|uniref:Uncharacterized protein n=1 Tax=Ameca splendens TaxID=208324 RepID=A0ABV0Y7G6_9TELE